MDEGRATSLERRAETLLWPSVERLVQTQGLAGLAIGVVGNGETVLRGFGTRDLRTSSPVTPETVFHLASVSKLFVATAVVGLATAGPEQKVPVLDLDAPVVRWIPDLTLADGRQAEIELRHLLTHTSGIPDVIDYGWHDPQLGDDALAQLVRGLSATRLTTAPGAEYAYCNLGYDVLGHVVATVTGRTFETAMRGLVLDPAGMMHSTFLRADVPPELASSPHVGAPLVVPAGAYPYTRRHAPSSTMHSSVTELARWMRATLAEPGTTARMWQPQAEVGDPPWSEAVGLGWFLGTHRGHRMVGHSGSDPGFGSRVALLPDRGIGVVVLANSNTALRDVVRATLDVALDLSTEEADVGALLPPITLPVAAALESGGKEAAVEAFHRLEVAVPAQVDADDAHFEDAVWGAVELHRPELVRPLLDVWATVRPNSSQAWAMAGWAHLVDGDDGLAAELLRRAIDLDAGNDDAAAMLRALGARSAE